MPSFQITLTLTIEAPDLDAATGVGSGAAQHLAETFNDDGSLLVVECSHTMLIPTDAEMLSASGVWVDPGPCGHVARDRAGRALATSTPDEGREILLTRAAAALRYRAQCSTGHAPALQPSTLQPL